MYCFYNISKTVFEENFWEKVSEENIAQMEKKVENNFYVFHKRYERIYINASNEYDMLLKLHKNSKIFIDDMPVYEEIMEWKNAQDKWKEGNRKWEFETEQEMYKYYVEEILAILRIYDYHFEKLDIIQ